MDSYCTYLDNFFYIESARLLMTLSTESKWQEQFYCILCNISIHLSLDSTVVFIRATEHRYLIEQYSKTKVPSIYYETLKQVFEPYPDPKNSPTCPQKVTNDPKIKSKSKVRIQGTIENKSCSTTWVQPKAVFLTLPQPWIKPIRTTKK